MINDYVVFHNAIHKINRIMANIYNICLTHKKPYPLFLSPLTYVMCYSEKTLDPKKVVR